MQPFANCETYHSLKCLFHFLRRIGLWLLPGFLLGSHFCKEG